MDITSVAEMWETTAAGLPADMPPSLYGCMRQVFYAGAFSMLTTIHQEIRKSPAPTQECTAALESFYDECEAFLTTETNSVRPS